jgi:hypothetical protein
MDKKLLKELKDLSYITDLKGKDFIKYDGLIYQANKIGLTKIKTKILQFPSKENEGTTIIQATVYDDKEKEFDGIGDSNDKSVGSMVVKHKIRMAETRAKARALRDFTGITLCSVEELGGDDKKGLTDAEKAEKKRLKKIEDQKKADEQKKKQEDQKKLAEEKKTTVEQLQKMFTCFTELKIDEKTVRLYLEKHYKIKKSSKELTKQQISEILYDVGNKDLRFDENVIPYFVKKEV